MALEDALCLTLLSGVCDVRLKEKLNELDPPTLPAFGVLIDAHLHCKATAGQAASANRTEGKNQQQKKTNAPKVSDAEKKRRQIMKGKCFLCGSSEHMANNCKGAKDVKCRTCNAQGHIQSACGQGKARFAEGSSKLVQTLLLWNISSLRLLNIQTLRPMLSVLLRNRGITLGLLRPCCYDWLLQEKSQMEYNEKIYFSIDSTLVTCCP